MAIKLKIFIVFFLFFNLLKSQILTDNYNIPKKVQKTLFNATDSLCNDTTFTLDFQSENRFYVYKIQKMGDLYVYTKINEIKLYTNWEKITGLSYFFGSWGLLINGDNIKLDKALHFSGGYITSMGSYAIAKKLKAKHPMWVGFASSAMIGLGKEVVYDYYLKKGTPTINDFVWTVLGGGYGVITIKVIIK